MNDLTQEQLMTAIEAAFAFYERLTGHQPTVAQVQALLAVAGIKAELARIKFSGDIVRELQAEEEQG